MSNSERASDIFREWYQGLAVYGGFPAKGTIGGALVVLERLKVDYNTDLDKHTAVGGSQIRGASGAGVRAILEHFGEGRPFLSEGGRTNRGLRGDIGSMLLALKQLKLQELAAPVRTKVLESFQEFLVTKVREFHSRQRLETTFDPAESTAEFVRRLLGVARENGKEGAVAQYLVGAKLQLRFPKEKIENESSSTADAQLGRAGDFRLKSSAFHITVAPMFGVYEKCKRNLGEGIKPYLIVPENLAMGAQQNADSIAARKITVLALVQFIAQNIDELAEFSSVETKRELKLLLEKYNERVDLIEADKSLLIKIPANL